MRYRLWTAARMNMSLERFTEILTPGLKNSHYAYFETLKTYINADTRLLDLGCGNKIIPIKSTQTSNELEYMTRKCKMICGIDSDIHQLLKNQTIENRILGDISRLAFHDSAFNVITASMVVEHIKDPFIMLHEIKRVLEPGGFFIIHTVNLPSYFGILSHIIPRRIKLKLIEKKGGKPGGTFPTFYNINNYFKVKKIAKKLNFKICELKLIETSITTHGLGAIMNLMELIMIRILRLKALKLLRPNIICVLQKVDIEKE